MNFDDLEGYHFMMSLPHDELLAKVKTHKGGKNLIFELNLDKDRTIAGFKIAKKTAKFVKKIVLKRLNSPPILPYFFSF